MIGQGKKYPKWLIPTGQVSVVIAIFALWEAGAQLGWLPVAFCGEPSGIAQALFSGLFASGVLWRALGWTMAGTFLAFAIGSALAIVAGMLFVLSPLLERVLDPLMAALNAMPRLALAPLLILWFGLGLGSKVAIGASLTFFIVLQSVVAGGRSVSQDHVTLATTLGLRPFEAFWKLTLPTAVPIVFAGLRLGFMYSLLGVVAGEIIASEHGLGQRIAYLTSSFDINGVWAVVFVLAIVGMVLSWGMAELERRLLRWR